MKLDGQHLGIQQPVKRVVVELKRRLNNEEDYDVITIDLSEFDLFGDDNVVQVVEPSMNKKKETSELPAKTSGEEGSVGSAHHFRANVKEVTAGLLALALIAYFLLTGLPSVSLPIIGGILGYYFGSRNTLLRN